jgi:hypothetical protein
VLLGFAGVCCSGMFLGCATGLCCGVLLGAVLVSVGARGLLGCVGAFLGCVGVLLRCIAVFVGGALFVFAVLCWLSYDGVCCWDVLLSVARGCCWGVLLVCAVVCCWAVLVCAFVCVCVCASP